MFQRKPVLAALVAIAALAGCRGEGELVVDQGVGITSVLSSCPAVGIPDYTGDVTLFSGGGKTAADLDVTAAMTNLRATCDDSGDKVYTTATFDVVARRADARGSRTVTIPYFVTVVRAGSAVVSKRVGEITLDFAEGEERASASGQAASYVDRAASSLPQDIRERITRRRRPGDPEAALDPLADPEVKAAIARTRFEMLIGFQLSEDQLAYNATR
ncbi:hypothetical protein [Erythrobacter sp. HL-111]|uniref:hypothetical protein n=1 Tax=Erythrobacter sp. HL-111 TaxID=1798193 RepID=UPI0006D9D4C6|nr:hypothetical protein [Erythrobacter sp. HL-111]KPP89754.1 MAG: hypothetical protein HLUCCO15_10075 [Erythrobacteraceae bacterium HL-111]SDT11296.1 hypothetical protein SAMN04515621_2937 [Erythrobacter sp. HL-111]